MAFTFEHCLQHELATAEWSQEATLSDPALGPLPHLAIEDSAECPKVDEKEDC